MLRPFTVDDLLNVNQFTSRCPWDLSPDGGLLAVTLSQGKRRLPGDTNYGENGAYIVLIDVETGESIEPFSDLRMSWAGRWSPDGQTLAAYVVTQDAHACVGLWNRQTHEVFLVSNAVIRGWGAVRNQHDQHLCYRCRKNRVVRGEASAKWRKSLGETRYLY